MGEQGDFWKWTQQPSPDVSQNPPAACSQWALQPQSLGQSGGRSPRSSSARTDQVWLSLGPSCCSSAGNVTQATNFPELPPAYNLGPNEVERSRAWKFFLLLCLRLSFLSFSLFLSFFPSFFLSLSFFLYFLSSLLPFFLPSFLSSSLSFFLYNWSIVDLQYYVSFRCTAKWFCYTYVCIYLYSFFRFFSIIVYYKILTIVPCAVQ